MARLWPFALDARASRGDEAPLEALLCCALNATAGSEEAKAAACARQDRGRGEALMQSALALDPERLRPAACRVLLGLAAGAAGSANGRAALLQRRFASCAVRLARDLSCVHRDAEEGDAERLAAAVGCLAAMAAHKDTREALTACEGWVDAVTQLCDATPRGARGVRAAAAAAAEPQVQRQSVRLLGALAGAGAALGRGGLFPQETVIAFLVSRVSDFGAAAKDNALSGEGVAIAAAAAAVLRRHACSSEKLRMACKRDPHMASILDGMSKAALLDEQGAVALGAAEGGAFGVEHALVEGDTAVPWCGDDPPGAPVSLAELREAFAQLLAALNDADD